MSQVTITIENNESEAFTRKRTKADRTRRTCVSCDKGIRMRQEFVATPAGPKHFMCAGMDHDLKACSSCFMLPADCTC